MSEIYKQTNMSIENLRASMEALCEPKKNILNKKNPKDKKFKPDDWIMLNLKYDNKSVKCSFVFSKGKKKKNVEPT